MSDGFKWTVTGGIIGLFLLTLGTILLIRLGNKLGHLNIDWIIGAAIPVAMAMMAWFYKYTDKIKQEDLKRIFEEINSKADQTEVNVLKEQVKEHKEDDKQNYDRLFEFVASVDSKLDILISNKK